MSTILETVFSIKLQEYPRQIQPVYLNYYLEAYNIYFLEKFHIPFGVSSVKIIHNKNFMIRNIKISIVQLI